MSTQRLGRSQSEVKQFLDSLPQRLDDVCRQLDIGSRPLNEVLRGRRNQVIPIISRLLVVAFLVHGLLVQAENPGFYIALRK